MLTDIQIKKLALPQSRKELPDGKIPGLYLILQPSGARSWAVRYRFAGQPKKLTLGPYPAIDLATARKRAQEALGDVAGGKDPARAKKTARAARKAERETEEHRLDPVATAYIERYVKREVGAAWGGESRGLRLRTSPGLGRQAHCRRRPSRMFSALLDAMVDRGSPITANRAFATLRQLLRIGRSTGTCSRCRRCQRARRAAETARGAPGR